MSMEQLTVYFGVDPGWKNGGFTVCVDGNPKNLIAYNLNDTAEFLDHLREYKGFDRQIILEEIPFYVGKNIPSSTGVKLGFSAGLIEGIALGENIPLHKVKPKKWQGGLSGLKGTSGAERKRILRGHAARLYPHLSPTLRTCDAILITNFFINNN